ncbi:MULTISPECIES: hypothetical protein [unclassified Sphingobacterium]|nr:MULTISPECIES: hypothetical protein [unclassified Sphingobacterium]
MGFLNELFGKGIEMEQGAQLSATKEGDAITAEFDELSRLINLNG